LPGSFRVLGDFSQKSPSLGFRSCLVQLGVVLEVPEELLLLVPELVSEELLVPDC